MRKNKINSTWNVFVRKHLFFSSFFSNILHVLIIPGRKISSTSIQCVIDGGIILYDIISSFFLFVCFFFDFDLATPLVML